jgi:hypothetical protein
LADFLSLFTRSLKASTRLFSASSVFPLSLFISYCYWSARVFHEVNRKTERNEMAAAFRSASRLTTR